jgi:aryl-alcohol dehydrogenase-like predicted oxidoreductase
MVGCSGAGEEEKAMKTRRLGWTEFNLTTVGLGTFAIGGVGWEASWGPQDDKDSVATILRSLDSGINWIDTAPIYGLGHAEEVVGRALKGLSRRPIISTKCGLVGDEQGKVSNWLKREGIRVEVEDSLRRLGIDVIDLYHVHWPIPDEDIEEAWGTIAQLIKEGKVRYAAASNFDVAQLKRIQAIHPVAAVQNPYSMLERELERGILDYCRQNNIGIVVWGPIAHGLLSGKFTKERVRNLDQDDSFRRNLSPHFKEPALDINLKLVKGLEPVARRNQRTLAQLAIAWVLRHPGVTSAIVGARKPAQIEETAKAADWELSREDIAEIDRLLDERERALNLT